MFQVGQHVICVDDRPLKGHVGIGTLKRGTIYTVREIVPSNGDEPCLKVEEIIRPCGDDRISEDTPYLQRRFRPLSSDRLSIFRQHLAPSPTDKVDA